MKTLKLNNYKKGFTIIEVVLVLAIAGLIFLMVFIALPALQRSQRDSLRKRHANSIVDAYMRKAANNRGNIWYSNFRALVDTGYIKEEELTDPSTGELYSYHEPAAGHKLFTNYTNIPLGSYGYDTGGYCQNNDPMPIPGTNNYKNIVIVIPLENGGWICASNDMR